MNNMKKTLRLTLLLLLMTVLVAGCKGKKKEVVPEATNTPATEAPAVATEAAVATATPAVTKDGQVQSKLTGLWVDEKVGARRPYAVMLNNIKFASPQSGTSQASVLYEAFVEGGYTRLMGIFEEFDTDRIGSVRSARHYYVSFADEWDAIFVHFGQTKYATKKIKELGINNLSGLTGIGATVFYRDQNIKAPHNAFASYKGIIKGTEKKKYRTEYTENTNQHYQFYQADTELTSDKVANKVKVGFSSYISPVFEYNNEEKVYYRSQYGKAHIDANNKEQLKFKNLIIQFVNEYDIDKNGYQTMDIADNSGTGLYISNGKAIDIKWQKNESKKTMQYFDKDGNLLSVNTGKTYIGIFPMNRPEDIKITEK